jgi:hypothetical protein
MTVARRLATLEGELDPTQRVVAWLAEAHAYDSFEGYLNAVIDAQPSQLPMDRLPREAAAAVRRERKGTASERDDAVHRAIRDVVLRVHLVLRIMDLTDSVIRHEELIVALLSAHVSLTWPGRTSPPVACPSSNCATCSSGGSPSNWPKRKRASSSRLATSGGIRHSSRPPSDAGKGSSTRHRRQP